MSDTTHEPVPSTANVWQSFADRFGDSLQALARVLTGGTQKPPRFLKSLLSGTFAGHPLHPAITDIPIGAWTLTAIFDIIWLAAPTSNSWAARGALIGAIIGLIAALGALFTGLADWSDTYGAERTVGFYHGLLNTAAFLLYLVSFILRLLSPLNENIAAAVLGFIGFVAILVAGYLGGDLVFVKGTNVNHTAWEAAGEDFEPVLPASSVEEGRLYRVTVASVPVVLLRRGEQYYAISATCPHAGGPLDEGTLDGDVVECPWHGSRFCVRDGRVLTGPATVPAPRYAVRVRNGQVELRRLGGH
ncbi:MAG: Rieske 2Fe-2S domain-containing protein [Thermogemmatispora sp.]|uniref:Rieske 2Fe-2S domain-containing protein n=1 Tax=Thermogemmatispora sp. TaxID=1968838 RepID=UPI002627C3E3|nr:Rieske 2Fe-2S domain-containing protein [Thermogemmatispora sp.]MBX5459127.1 Rieske 2Fe-2S domain-containing protein [Thermogemmatispora sp.]